MFTTHIRMAAVLLLATGSMMATQSLDLDVAPLQISQAKMDGSRNLLTIRGYNLGAQDVRVTMNGEALQVVSRHPSQIVVVLPEKAEGSPLVRVSRGSKKVIFKVDAGNSRPVMMAGVR